MTNNGESKSFLRSQLNLARELLLLEYGPLLSNEKFIQNGHFQKPQYAERISTVLNTMCSLCDEKQAFLVQSVEDLLGHSISSEVKSNIQSILQYDLKHMPDTSHALLFVGTKLLSHYKKDKRIHLSSRDIFLLIIFFTSHFNPQIPKQNDPINVQELFDGNIEYIDEIKQIYKKYEINDIIEILNLADLSKSATHITIKCLKIVLQTSGVLTAGKVDINFCEHLADCILEYQEKHSLPATGNITLETIRSIAKTEILEGNWEAQGLSDEEIEAALAICYIAGYAPKHDHLSMMMNQLSIKEHSKEPLKAVYQQIYLSRRDQPYTIYCTPLHREYDQMITLVILSSKSEKSEEDLENFEIVEHNIRNAIVDVYVQYLFSMEKSYTMITHTHQIPGLIHFILADRSMNKVLAPEITSLIGQDSDLEEQSPKVYNCIKRHIWNMYYQSQEFLTKGFFDMIMKYGEFQYSFKLYFEDFNGVRMIPHKKLPIPANKTINRDFYKTITKTLFPDEGGAVKCYELYCLYVGSVSTKTIELHNEAIIATLNKKRNN